jgi:hypothetical protein
VIASVVGILEAKVDEIGKNTSDGKGSEEKKT